MAEARCCPFHAFRKNDFNRCFALMGASEEDGVRAYRTHDRTTALQVNPTQQESTSRRSRYATLAAAAY